MGVENIRVAFLHAAEGRLRLDHAGMTYQGLSQVLSFTGWHSDGTPFAMVTAPFDGSPAVRARRAARDIIQTHAGAPSSSAPTSAPISSLRRQIDMSQKGSGLARLMGGLKSLDESADTLATRLETAMGRLQAEMATTMQIVSNVESSVNDLRSVNALYSNGGSPLPTSDGSAGPSSAQS